MDGDVARKYARLTGAVAVLAVSLSSHRREFSGSARPHTRALEVKTPFNACTDHLFGCAHASCLGMPCLAVSVTKSPAQVTTSDTSL